MNITYRDIREDDKAFIFATWLRGLYYGNPWWEEIDKDAYHQVYHQVIETLLSRSLVKVACLADDTDVVLGYCVTSPDEQKLHWVFVKKSWRKMGIAKALVPKTITTITHITKVGKALKPDHWKFNPFL